MKKGTFLALFLSLSWNIFSQTIEEARVAIDNENYIKARNILSGMAANGDKKAAYYLGNAYLKMDEPDSAKMFYNMVGTETKSAYGKLANGRMALLAGDKAKAKSLFESAAIAAKYKDAEVLYQIGDAWYKPTTTDLAEAIKNFEDAYNLDVKHITNMLSLGDAYLDNNEGGKAMSKYESAADVNKNLALSQIKIGRLSVRGRMYQEAIAAYEKAVKLEPNNALPHKELAEAYYLAKSYDKSKNEFKAYIDINKEDADAKIKYIAFLFGLKEYENVITEGSKMLDSDPNNYQLLRALTFSNYELKRYKEGYDFAKRFWPAAQGKKIKGADYLYSAKLAAQVGDTANAGNYFIKAIEYDSANSELYSEYAKILWGMKRYDESIKWYNLKGSKFGFNSMDLYYIGRAYYSQKNYVACDTTFAKFAEKNPNSPDSYIWRAKSKSNLDPDMKIADAKPLYEKYIEVAKSEPVKYKKNLTEAYNYLAAYYLNKNDIVNAKVNLNAAIAIDPADEFANTQLKGLK